MLAVGSTQERQKLQTSNKLNENPKPKLNKPSLSGVLRHNITGHGLDQANV